MKNVSVKLILENFRKFINEEEESAAKVEEISSYLAKLPQDIVDKILAKAEEKKKSEKPAEPADTSRDDGYNDTDSSSYSRDQAYAGTYKTMPNWMTEDQKKLSEAKKKGLVLKKKKIAKKGTAKVRKQYK